MAAQWFRNMRLSLEALQSTKGIGLVRFIAAALVGLFVCGFSGQDTPQLPGPQPQSQSSRPISQLKEDVDRLLAKSDSVSIRRNIGDIFALVDRLVEAKQQDEACKYLREGLKHKSWALDYQLLYAEIKAAQGDRETAREKAHMVLLHAEKDAQINRARKLLDQAPLPEVPKMVKLLADEPTLVLVPVGRVDTCVLEGLRERLVSRIGIPVLSGDAAVRVHSADREPCTSFLAELRKRIRTQVLKDTGFSSFLRKNGITLADLEQDSVVEKAGRLYAKAAGGSKALKQFEAKMAALRRAQPQWDIDRLRKSLYSSVHRFGRSNLYFMGITNLDVFADRNNFVFGTALFGSPLSVISYRRFSADFYGMPPKRERLIDRTFKQALSSLGFMMGVHRCSSPTCARAYPHNLAEHDAKSMELCNDCKAAFERILRVKLEDWEVEGPPRFE